MNEKGNPRPSALRLRPATSSDQDEIRALIFSILVEYQLEPAPKTTDADLFDIETFYAGGIFDVFVSTDGKIVGAVGLRANEDGGAELRKMYLSQKFRGRGHGGRLLKHAIARARALNFKRIDLETARVLKEAIGLYEKFGFVLTDRENPSQRCDHVMVLRL